MPEFYPAGPQRLGETAFELVRSCIGGELVVTRQSRYKVKSGEMDALRGTLNLNTVFERVAAGIPAASRRCTVDLEHVSLFRRHLEDVPAVCDAILPGFGYINPGVFAFPGGCMYEGTEIPDRYR